jgi:hypothetical protein
MFTCVSYSACLDPVVLNHHHKIESKREFSHTNNVFILQSATFTKADSLPWLYFVAGPYINRCQYRIHYVKFAFLGMLLQITKQLDGLSDMTLIPSVVIEQQYSIC